MYLDNKNALEPCLEDHTGHPDYLQTGPLKEWGYFTFPMTTNFKLRLPDLSEQYRTINRSLFD